VRIGVREAGKGRKRAGGASGRYRAAMGAGVAEGQRIRERVRLGRESKRNEKGPALHRAFQN
jgi:hypothetical protein